MAQAKSETHSRLQINLGAKGPSSTSDGGREQFVNAVADMAAEVWDFHERFGIDSGNIATRACHEVIIKRAPMLREEFEEMLEAAKSKDESETCHEAADVLFVAIGNIESLGNAGSKAFGPSPPRMWRRLTRRTRFDRTPANYSRSTASRTSGSK